MAQKQVEREYKGSKGKRTIALIALFLIMILLATYAYYWAQSSRGQRTISDVIIPTLQKLNPVTWYTNLLTDAQTSSQNLWTSKQNATSDVKGLVFEAFRPVSTSEYPQGTPISFEYVLELKNMNVNNMEITVQCSIQGKELSSQQGLVLLPNNGKFVVSGTRIYDDVRCVAQPELTKKLDGTLTFVGSVSFPFQTKDVALPVYFTTRDVDEMLQGEDFFKYFDIMESQPIRAVYDGEPIEVGIGVSTENKQPVIISGTRTPLIGISLRNRWEGNMKSLNDLVLTVPKEMKLNKELSQNPNPLCPLLHSRSGTNLNEYRLASQYKGISLEKGKTRSFECWFDADEDIIPGGALYSKEEYRVTADYDYQLSNKTAAVTIKKISGDEKTDVQQIIGTTGESK